MKATGTFEVKLAPIDSYAEGSEGLTLGRMSIDKTFSGDLEASSKGEMLSARTREPSSAGYVAIEQVSGTLEGKSGSFALQHFGVMDNGKDRLILEVIPDSGSGELTGISGTMGISMSEGKHLYTFEYQLGN